MKLIIANKNYSSWSLRAWLLLRQADIPFEEELIRFAAPDFAERVRRYSPAGRVPVLLDGEQRIWDSLSIAEYVAETFPEKQLWPADRSPRALARSLCAEMHAGLPNLPPRMPMNREAPLPGARTEVAVQRDIDRILEIWGDCRKAHAAGGPFLFGNFSIADAYFAPVVSRFATYGVALDATAQAYADHIAGLPAMQEWVRAALDEREFVAHDEPYRRQR